MAIDRLDHLVLTVVSIDRTVDFYTRVLEMEVIEFGNGRKALIFGNQKINLHEKGHEFEPKAFSPTPGSADLCFITSNRLENVAEKIRAMNIEIVEGPVARTGATGPIQSIYLRDPDQNLIEISTY